MRSPAGSVSLKPIPVKAALAFVFVTVKLSDVVPLSGIDGAPNTWVTTGAAVTPKLAVATLPVPPLADVTAVVVLIRSPGTVAWMLTLNVHEPADGSVAPDRLTFADPVVAVIVPPPQDPVKPFGVAMTRPAGRVSVNPTPVSARLFV